MRHWPGGLAARRVLVAAGPWPAACRRGTQRLAGLRGGAAAPNPMAPLSPPPGWMCSRDPHRRLATLTLAAARSSGLGSRWRPASRRVGLQPARRGCARGRGRGLDQHPVTAIARSLPDYFTGDVARPGMSAAVSRPTASMTPLAGRHGTAHHTPCLIQVLPRRAVPPICALACPTAAAVCAVPKDRYG